MKKANVEKMIEVFERGSELVEVIQAVPEELKELSDELEKIIDDEAASGTESEDELNEFRYLLKKMRNLEEGYLEVFGRNKEKEKCV